MSIFFLNHSLWQFVPYQQQANPGFGKYVLLHTDAVKYISNFNLSESSGHTLPVYQSPFKFHMNVPLFEIVEYGSSSSFLKNGLT